MTTVRWITRAEYDAMLDDEGCLPYPWFRTGQRPDGALQIANRSLEYRDIDGTAKPLWVHPRAPLSE